jgi:hypothetical protein
MGVFPVRSEHHLHIGSESCTKQKNWSVDVKRNFEAYEGDKGERVIKRSASYVLENINDISG